jgi:hypothetical protein
LFADGGLRHLWPEYILPLSGKPTMLPTFAIKHSPTT